MVDDSGLDSVAMSSTHTDLEAAVRAALSKVVDPELRRPITEVGMVKSVSIADDHSVASRRHARCRTKPCAGVLSPSRPGPNHGKQIGTPPRIALPGA